MAKKEIKVLGFKFASTREASAFMVGAALMATFSMVVDLVYVVWGIK